MYVLINLMCILSRLLQIYKKNHNDSKVHIKWIIVTLQVYRSKGKLNGLIVCYNVNII